ncbi:class I SAM-dependent methyltransferase [Sphingomonas sp. NBWT7]|uniref:class I SAM-dependent methyltransferase n=1 Tax=Sphingomonas sp. NBWT7 TaxID=2596913 RepID=UPI00162977D6|nr:class I SAM-dependent methyltransferase [Sphingomonas sp. NBWT7]QNE31849.1 class I SAM-dependent methyltransferase [Sphingomonas sp. NBWT7]
MTTAPEWQTRVGDVWAAEWRRTDRSFADLSRQLDVAIAAVAPEDGRAADLGCGAGVTSLSLAAARPGLAIDGFDLSPALIDVARARAAGQGAGNVTFAVGAVPAALGATPRYDLAVSRHGVMFFDDPRAAFAGIRTAMTPGAALVFSCFRTPAENPWAAGTIAALGGRLDPPHGYAPGPFAFADRTTIVDLLTGAGFGDVCIAAADYRYCAGAGPDPAGDGADFFRRIGTVSKLFAAANEADRPVLVNRLRAHLATHVRGDVLDFPAAAWIVTARA